MTRSIVSASAVIPAPPERIYGILADYHQGHPAIVPKKYFRKLEVESGGQGAGTKLRLEMRVLGSTYVSKHVVSEPEPGRVLVEANVDGSTKTTFTVESLSGKTTTLLVIETEFAVQKGFAGKIQRMLTQTMLRRIYTKELKLIRRYALSGNP
jgi:hypothetical protein